MSKVFVLDAKKHPLNPVHPGRARILLSSGKAAVLKEYPFTILLKSGVEAPALEPLRIKIDPGSKVTGLALVNDTSGAVVFAAELSHRGQALLHWSTGRRVVVLPGVVPFPHTHQRNTTVEPKDTHDGMPHCPG